HRPVPRPNRHASVITAPFGGCLVLGLESPQPGASYSMAIQERRNEVLLAGGAMRRFVRTRPVLLVAAVLFVGLVEFAGLAPIPAAIGFAVIALAVLIREAATPGVDEALIYGERTTPLLADRMVDAIIAGLSDPAFALAPDSQ